MLKPETKYSNVEHQSIIFDHFMNKLRNQFIQVFENAVFSKFTNVDKLTYKFKPFPLTQYMSEKQIRGEKQDGRNGKSGDGSNKGRAGSSEKEE